MYSRSTNDTLYHRDTAIQAQYLMGVTLSQRQRSFLVYLNDPRHENEDAYNLVALFLHHFCFAHIRVSFMYLFLILPHDALPYVCYGSAIDRHIKMVKLQ